MPAALRGNLTYILPEEVMYLLSRFKKTGRLDMGSGSVYFHGGIKLSYRNRRFCQVYFFPDIDK